LATKNLTYPQKGGITMTDEIKAYCMKCKAERVVSNVAIVTMKNGRPAAQGICPVCGTKMFKFLPASKKPAATAESTPMAEANPTPEPAPTTGAESTSEQVG
jgi:RNase P subunit RPR2